MKTSIFIVLTLVIIGFVVVYPHVMIAPGNVYQAHNEIQNNCLSCHKPFSGTPNEKCISCHKVAEIGMKSNKVQFHQKIESQNCISCHSEHKGINSRLALNKFDHILLPEKDRNSCVSCHSQPKNNLHNQVSNSCVSCHSTRSWTAISSFNHDAINANSRNNCTSCHQSPKDKIHSISTANCISCHSQDQWKPSTFDHSKYFQLDKNHNVSCTNCHKTNDFKDYTCFGCHEHTMANIRSEHLEEGITNFTNCVKCHKSANEDDIRRNEKEVIKYINDNKEEDD
jgi:Class III cytochrome C family